MVYKFGVPKRVILLASYCGGGNADCTDHLPCNECIRMCNVAVVKQPSEMKVLGGIDYLRYKRTVRGDLPKGDE